jgi:hypothetical protein
VEEEKAREGVAADGAARQRHHAADAPGLTKNTLPTLLPLIECRLAPELAIVVVAVSVTASAAGQSDGVRCCEDGRVEGDLVG